MKYVKELDDLFRKHEIHNYADFADSAELSERLGDKRLQVSENALLLVDLYSDPNDIGYFYIVDKKAPQEEWKLVYVHASYQLNTVRNEEGVLVIAKVHYEPVPSKPVIQKEILDKIVEENKYELSLQQQRQQSVAAGNGRFRKR